MDTTMRDDKDVSFSHRESNSGFEKTETPIATGHAAGNALLIAQDGTVRRLPIPTSDPNDPLLLGKWQKTGIVVSCCWFSIMSLSLSGGLGAILNVFFGIYIPMGITANQVVQLLTVPALFVGVGNFFILPLSLIFGRRPTFLLSVICVLFFTVGCALSNTWQVHLTMRILAGLATGATESLLPLMLADISFLHERGQIFAWYWAIQTLFSSALNVASSYEATISWRWFYWVYVIALTIGLLFSFFTVVETRFDRPPMSVDGQVVFTDQFGVTQVFSDDEAQAHLAELERARTVQSGHARTKKTFIQTLKPWSGVCENPGKVMAMSWVHMLECFTSPGIVYATLVASIVLGCAIGISLTYNTVLENVYGWPAKNVGLINVGGMIGALLGMAYAGWPADKFNTWMARRNHGIHKPEHRFLVLIPVGILGVVSLLLYGFTSTGHDSWWGPYMGWTLYEVTFVSTLIIVTTFAAEAWPKNPGPAIVVVVGTKNIVSFGASYGLTPMVMLHGYPWAMGVLAGILGAIFLLGVPVWFLNPMWRAYVAKREAKALNVHAAHV